MHNKKQNTTVKLLLTISLVMAPVLAEAKKLKPKYYKDCYAGYKDMRELVPKPPVDVQKTAKTIGAVAGIAGRFGGFGGGLGSAAATASTVAQYSETIADVAAFTENMAQTFPQAEDRYLAYGERMQSEAGEMQQVADFAIASQECYAQAYVELSAAKADGSMKKKEIKKRHSEIKTGVENVSVMLNHATAYMDTNISAYNQALTQETTGAGLNLDNILSLASQATNVATQVDGLTPGSADGWAGTGWTPTEARMEAHRQAMAAQYAAAGVPNPYAAPAVNTAGLLGGFGSLTSLAALGSINSGMAAHMALEQGVAQANLAAAGASAPAAAAPVAAAQPTSMTAQDPRIKALAQAGNDVGPYLESYNRIRALEQMQRGVAGFVKGAP